MSIMAKKQSDFKPAPEGQFVAVCCDVVDLGMVETTWKGEVKMRHKIRVCFQIDKINPDDGKPYLVMQRFTLSMHENGWLRPFLESWRGKPYTEDQAADGIDVELMVGVGALLQIVHNTHNGTTYANINSIMKAPKGSEIPEVTDYVRVQDRPAEDGAARDDGPPIGEPQDDYSEADDDLPF